MKASIVTSGMTCLVLITAASAQDGQPRTVSRQPAPPPTPTAAATPLAKTDPSVLPANNVVPPLTPPGPAPGAGPAHPNSPIEPWLLTKDAGPFMVMAKTFRGPEAERFALALAMELRRDYGLPAYILRTKDFPMRSFHQGVPPLAPKMVKQPHLTEPEKVRSYDEAMVLVGDEKTLLDSEQLLHRVKRIKPKDPRTQVPSIFRWRVEGRGGLNTWPSGPRIPYVPDPATLFPAAVAAPRPSDRLRSSD